MQEVAAQGTPESGAHMTSVAMAGVKSDVLEEAAVTRGPYALRELHLVNLEAEGSLKFVYVKNDGSPQNMMWCDASASCLAETYRLGHPENHLFSLSIKYIFWIKVSKTCFI